MTNPDYEDAYVELELALARKEIDHDEFAIAVTRLVQSRDRHHDRIIQASPDQSVQ